MLCGTTSIRQWTETEMHGGNTRRHCINTLVWRTKNHWSSEYSGLAMSQLEWGSKRAPGRLHRKVYTQGRQARNVCLSNSGVGKDFPPPPLSNTSNPEGALVMSDTVSAESLVTPDEVRFMKLNLNRLPTGISPPYGVLQCFQCF